MKIYLNLEDDLFLPILKPMAVIVYYHKSDMLRISHLEIINDVPHFLNISELKSRIEKCELEEIFIIGIDLVAKRN